MQPHSQSTGGPHHPDELAFPTLALGAFVRDSLLSHKAQGSTSTSQIAAVGPTEAGFSDLRDNLPETIIRLSSPLSVEVTMSWHPGPRDRISTIMQHRLIEEFFAGQNIAQVNDYETLSQGPVTALLFETTAIQALETAQAVTSAGYEIVSLSYGFELLPPGLPYCSATWIPHDHSVVFESDLKSERDDIIDLTAISVPVGPTTVLYNVTADDGVTELKQAYYRLQKQIQHDEVSVRDCVAETIYKIEILASNVTTWSPPQDSTLLLYPRAVHRAPLPFSLTEVSSVEVLKNKLTTPASMPRARIVTSLMVARPDEEVFRSLCLP